MPLALDKPFPSAVSSWGAKLREERASKMFTRSESGKLGYQKTQGKLTEHREAQKAAARAEYEANLPHCAFCDGVLPYEKRTQKFCNHSCAASFTNRGVAHNPCQTERRSHCLRCRQPVQGTGKLYCSRDCASTHRVERFAENLLSGTGTLSSGSIPAIRRCLIRLRGEQCEKCGWNERHSVTKRVPLEVHHVDGNFENNTIGNVRLLCPNCHSLTPSFRNLNKGNGRGYRKITPG